MSKTPLTIQSVHLKEAPGIGDGLEKLTDLARGVNVIYGPNGSGKSTTLRMMQACLSPGGRNNPLRLVGDRVETNIQAGNATTTINLRDEGPAVTHGHSLELREGLVVHARFSLKELLDATGRKGFGEAIEEAAAGGVNLVRTAEALRLDRRTTPRPTDRNALRKLRRELDDAVSASAAMEGREKRLTALQHEADELSAKQERRDVLLEAQKHRSNLDEAIAARLRFESFPATLAQLSGDEAEQVREGERLISDAEATLRKARDEGREAQTARRDTGLKSPLAHGLLAQAGNLKDNLQSLEQACASLEQDRADAQSRMIVARSLIGDEVSDEALRRIEPDLLNRMEEWCDRIESFQGKWKASETLKTQLGDLTPPEPSQADANITLLRQWLAAERQDQTVGSARRLLLTAAVVVLVAAVILGITIDPWLYLLLTGAIVLGVAWWLTRPEGRSSVEQDILKRGMQAPAALDPPSVHALISQLENSYKHELEQQGRHDAWANQLTALQQEVYDLHQELATEREQLLDELGFAPMVSEKSFGLLARALRDWLSAYSALGGADSALAKNEHQAVAGREKIREKMTALLPDSVPETFRSSEVAGWLEDLSQRDGIFGDASRAVTDAVTEIRSARATIRQERNRIAGIYEKAGLEQGDFPVLNALVSQVEEYRDAERKHTRHGVANRQASDFFAEYNKLEGTSFEQLETELSRLGDPSNELRTVNRDIGAVENELQNARRSTAAEEKRNEFDGLREELHLQREGRLEKLGGWLLAKQIHDEVARETKPAVQNRAAELLQQFTSGQCELCLVDGTLMGFQPGRDREPVELEKLSDGTRVQLFIAMRLAFVEHEEGGYQMPLFFDEALANTDDHRAPAVMKTLLSIAGSGRQVFYFTSQADEAGKWKKAFEEAGVEHRILPLRPDFSGSPITANIPPLQRVVVPQEGETFSDYVSHLGMAQVIDPWIQSVDDISLVHVLDDPSDLSKFLELGIGTWGPLQRLGEEEAALRRGHSAFNHAAKRAGFLLEVAQLWQQGRGRPLKRKDLEAARIKNTPARDTLEQAWLAAEDRDRDAERLCTALEEGDLKIDGVAKGGIKGLREHCEDTELIVSGAPLPDGELRIRAENAARRIGLDKAESQKLLEPFEARQYRSKRYNDLDKVPG